MQSTYRNLILLLIMLFAQSAASIGQSEAQDALIDVQFFDSLSGQRPRSIAGVIGKRYVWNFQQKTYTVLIEINVEAYNAYASLEHVDVQAMVHEGTTAMAKLTQAFQNVIAQSGFRNEEAANFVLAFVQALPYTVDSVTTGYDEFRRYAIETLVEGGGDCEDTTILVGSILNGLGVQLVLVDLPGHIAIGVSGNFSGSSYALDGTKYFYGETTGSGWAIGQIPNEYAQTSARLLPIREGQVIPGGSVQKVVKPAVKSTRQADNFALPGWVVWVMVGLIVLIGLIAFVSMQPRRAEAPRGQKREPGWNLPRTRRPSGRGRRASPDDINLYQINPNSRDRHSGEDLGYDHIDSERK